MFPFNFHWYAGVPPLTGVAVNVTFVPAQMVLPGEATIETDGVTLALTVIVIAFEVTGFGFAQVMDEVITQVITSPFINELFA